MRIQHNITALSAANKLKSNESTVSKNIQKLSSGYRINSAADDAAGLAVSEKMRKQINGLSQAEDNTKNGISLIQTAEGGLNETSAILQRMNTLAVESSNGTYKNEDRANLQKEMDHLNTEIDRISTSTKFNEISLLDGSHAGVSYTPTVTDAGGFLATSGDKVTISGGSVGSLEDVAPGTGPALTISTDGSKVVTVGLTAAITGVSFTSTDASADNSTMTFKAVVAAGSSAAAQAYDGMTVTVHTGTLVVSKASTVTSITDNSKEALSFQVGAENINDQRASLAVGKMDATTLGTKTIDISNQTGARSAIDTIKSAIASVSSTRADLGALQNELEHTANNLSTMSENLTSAESTIRDVDMTDEYVQYSKNQILSQAANSMLAQANAQPQNVLTLLKG